MNDPFDIDNGALIDPSALIEISNYIGPTEGIFLHKDNLGNITVVDANGKLLDSPPTVYTHDGKYYIHYIGMKEPFDIDNGALIDPSALIEIGYFKPPSASNSQEAVYQ
jgi:hypothetical protein